MLVDDVAEAIFDDNFSLSDEDESDFEVLGKRVFDAK